MLAKRTAAPTPEVRPMTREPGVDAVPVATCVTDGDEVTIVGDRVAVGLHVAVGARVDGAWVGLDDKKSLHLVSTY